jgi:hypothetical protein
MDSFRMAPTIRTVDLVRSWLGQALRATGAAVVVPVAILVALSLTAIGGSGLGGLGTFSQLVSGPRAPGSDVTVDDGDSEIGDAVTQLAAAGSEGLAGAPGTVPGGQPVTGPGGGDTPGAALPPGSGPPPGGGGDDIDPLPPGGGGGGGGTPPPPTPPPPPQPGVVEGVGQTVTDVTSGTPLAPTVEDAVDGLVEVCGRLGCP